MKLPVWGRSSPAIIGSERIVETTGTPHALAPQTLERRPEVAVSRKQDHVVDARREFHGVDHDLDAHVSLTLRRPCLSVNSFAGFVTKMNPSYWSESASGRSGECSPFYRSAVW